MARFEGAVGDVAALGEAGGGADEFLKLGTMYSTSASMPADYVSAHRLGR